MSETPMNLKAYFERIGYSGNGEPTAETLRQLQTGHVFHIPFENLDVLEGKRISLEPSDLFQKLVTNKRGGYCFEMNGLFSYVLEQLGFPVRPLLARVWRGDSGYGAKTHQVLLVTAGGKEWLCDVGFGGNGLLEPLLFEIGKEQKQYFLNCRIMEEPLVNGYVYQCMIDGEFKNVYAFTLEPCTRVDYELSNHYTSTHPDSRFTQLLTVVIPNQNGRISIFDRQLKIIEDENVKEITLETDADRKQALSDYFNL